MFPIFSRVFLFFFPQTSRFMVDVPILFSNQIPMFSHAFPHEKALCFCEIMGKTMGKNPTYRTLPMMWGIPAAYFPHFAEAPLCQEPRRASALRKCPGRLKRRRNSLHASSMNYIYIYCIWNYCMFFFELNHVEPSKF